MAPSYSSKAYLDDALNEYNGQYSGDNSIAFVKSAIASSWLSKSWFVKALEEKYPPLPLVTILFGFISIAFVKSAIAAFGSPFEFLRFPRMK